MKKIQSGVTLLQVTWILCFLSIIIIFAHSTRKKCKTLRFKNICGDYHAIRSLIINKQRSTNGEGFFDTMNQMANEHHQTTCRGSYISKKNINVKIRTLKC